jgi:predicted DCC family thiol-disulfide oxidoreductase YuxK
MAHYIRADRAGVVRFTDLWQQPERLSAAGLDHEAAMAMLHARLGDGLLCGVPVFFEIWRRLPGWRWVAKFLSPLERARWVAALYDTFARRRLRRRCAGDACDGRVAEHRAGPPRRP